MNGIYLRNSSNFNTLVYFRNRTSLGLSYLSAKLEANQLMISLFGS